MKPLVCGNESSSAQREWGQSGVMGLEGQWRHEYQTPSVKKCVLSPLGVE